jgi:hypothetical protein
MEPAKYIIFDQRVAVIFSPTQSHAHVALCMGMSATSAGFCGVDDAGQVQAWGESLTLKLGSDPGDNELLRRLLRPY